MPRFEHHEHYLRKSVVFFLNHSGNEVLDRGIMYFSRPHHYFLK